jgi:ribonuclease HI
MSETKGTFRCRVCGSDFQVPPAVLAKYPGWTPSKCLRCKNAADGAAKPRLAQRSGSAVPAFGRSEPRLTGAQILERYHDGPKTGLFTDGSASPNPGPGGWGVVYVVDNEILDELSGKDPDTTNNRMELAALIAAYKLSPPTVPLDVWTDSNLCVQTINEWAPAWKQRGWRRNGGPIKNLELVQELYALALSRPNLTLRWLRAHDGSRWNEYADWLAAGER